MTWALSRAFAVAAQSAAEHLRLPMPADLDDPNGAATQLLMLADTDPDAALRAVAHVAAVEADTGDDFAAAAGASSSLGAASSAADVASEVAEAALALAAAASVRLPSNPPTPHSAELVTYSGGCHR